MRSVLVFFLFAQFSDAAVKVIWQRPADWPADIATDGKSAKAVSIMLLTADPAADPLQFRFLNFNGETENAVGTWATGSLGTSVPRPVRVEISLKSADRSRQGYLVITPRTGEPVLAALKIQVGEAHRVEEVLCWGLVAGTLLVVVAGVQILLKSNAQALNKILGAASWEFGSWATNTTVVGSALTAVVGLPSVAGWTKFEWSRNYALVAAIAALLVAIAPGVYNLSRSPKDGGDGKLIYNGRVWMFLLVSLLTATGAATQLRVALLAVGELGSQRVLTGDVVRALNAVLGVFGLALGWYIARSIPMTVEAQINPKKPAGVLAAQVSPTTHSDQSFFRVL